MRKEFYGLRHESARITTNFIGVLSGRSEQRAGERQESRGAKSLARARRRVTKKQLYQIYGG